MLLSIGFGIAVFAALCIGYNLGYNQARADQRHREDDELRYERQMTIDDYDRVQREWTDAQISDIIDNPRKKVDDS